MPGLLHRLFHRAPKGAIPDEVYALTYPECADFLLRRLHAHEPPFDRSEWHLALVEIPSDWDSVFEIISWMNSLAVFVLQVWECHGESAGSKLANALVEHLRLVFGESGEDLAPFFTAILYAPALPSDDPVLLREDTREWSSHLMVFGRAKAALDLVSIEDRHRPEALSRLGRCMIYGTHCSATRFGTAVRKIRFSEEEPEPSDATGPPAEA